MNGLLKGAIQELGKMLLSRSAKAQGIYQGAQNLQRNNYQNTQQALSEIEGMLGAFLTPQQIQGVKQTPQWMELQNKSVAELQSQAGPLMWALIGQLKPHQKAADVLDFFGG